MGAAGLTLLVATSCSDRFGAPDPASDRGRSILELWRLLTVAGLVVGGIVVVLIVWCLVRYRDRGDGTQPARFRDHLPLEIAYTAVPLVIVAALFAATFGTERTVDAVSAGPDVTVRVTAFNWGWRFEYPDVGAVVLGRPGAPPELVVPAGRRVRFVLTSNDVIHAFFVPGFLFKRDAIPGIVNEFEVVPEGPGRVFRGQCAEFCGLDHAAMDFTVRVETPDAFESWAASAAASSSAPPTPPPPTPSGSPISVVSPS